MVIVELRPSVKGSDSGLKSGQDDIKEMARLRAAAAAERQAHEEEKVCSYTQRTKQDQQPTGVSHPDTCAALIHSAF